MLRPILTTLSALALTVALSHTALAQNAPAAPATPVAPLLQHLLPFKVSTSWMSSPRLA